MRLLNPDTDCSTPPGCLLLYLRGVDLDTVSQLSILAFFNFDCRIVIIAIYIGIRFLPLQFFQLAYPLLRNERIT